MTLAIGLGGMFLQTHIQRHLVVCIIATLINSKNMEGMENAFIFWLIFYKNISVHQQHTKGNLIGIQLLKINPKCNYLRVFLFCHY